MPIAVKSADDGVPNTIPPFRGVMVQVRVEPSSTALAGAVPPTQSTVSIYACCCEEEHKGMQQKLLETCQWPVTFTNDNKNTCMHGSSNLLQI
jgi:hypothetical protein